MKSLRPLFTQRAAIFRDRPTAEFTVPASWQLSATRAANFAEAGIVWRCGRHVAVAAIRPDE